MGTERTVVSSLVAELARILDRAESLLEGGRGTWAEKRVSVSERYGTRVIVVSSTHPVRFLGAESREEEDDRLEARHQPE